MAIIYHSRPSGISWAISGTGASFLTSSSFLTDNRPAQKSRVQWLSSGSPATTDYVTLQATWGTAQTIRGGFLLGLVKGTASGSPLEYSEDVAPANVKVEIRGRRPGDGSFAYALGGNALTAETVQFQSGKVGLVWLFDDALDALNGVEIRIYNDSNGSTWMTADDYLDIGEAFVGSGDSWEIRHEWGNTIDDPSVIQRSISNQPYATARTRAKVYDVEICPQGFTDAYAASASLSYLREQLLAGAPCGILPGTKAAGSGAAAATDYNVVQQLALFGYCEEVGQIRAVPGGHYYTLPLRFREAPA